MVDLHTIEWMSHKPEEFHMITEEVHEIVKNSPVKNGAVLVPYSPYNNRNYGE
ncbi:MAG: hypothetical protein ACLUJR_12420 [Mediterraneibacter gnavus]